MKALEAIYSRRSIRVFTGDEVPQEDVEKMLRAAMTAPSACNQQPWHFVVVRDKETHRRIMGVQKYTAMLEKASVAIIVCAQPGLEKCPGFWVQDVSAAAENILLAAHALGYGATWCGLYPRDDPVWGVREIIGAPKDVVPFCVIAVGVPGEEKPPSQRYKRERVHFERW
ncbi:MAG TPA: nitroreductase family protein [Candidatus Bathyarchaeota archaeon]|nr:nitroreductase family protein [Candidatus Bathyarchaeota archaeon]